MTNNASLEYALRQLSPTERDSYYAAVRIFDSKDGAYAGRSACDCLPEAILEHYGSIMGRVNKFINEYFSRQRESNETERPPEPEQKPSGLEPIVEPA